jgi:hypothetical protein
MLKPRTLRHIAVCGVSLPTFAVSPSVAKATVYMPSQVAARVLGGRPARKTVEPNAGEGIDQAINGAESTPHAA